MKNVFTIIGFAFLIFSCKKGQADMNITLKLSNASYGGSLEGATVMINKTMSGTGSSVLVGNFSSNALGEIKFTTKRDKFDYLTVQIQKNNYFSRNETIYLSDLTADETNMFQYSIKAKAWAAIHLRTTSGNSVNIQKNGGKSGCDECCTSAMTYFAGPIDTTFYCINDANTTYSFIYFINGGASSGEKSAITNFADTTELLLDF